jgi:hypothetical protein
MQKETIAKQSVYWLKVISLGLILGIGIQFAQAWTNPLVAPPSGNVSGPLTTSNAGQIKEGNLAINTGWDTDGDNIPDTWGVNGLIVAHGSVSIGTVTSGINYPIDIVRNANTTIGIRIQNQDAGNNASARFIASNGTTELNIGVAGTGISGATHWGRDIKPNDGFVAAASSGQNLHLDGANSIVFNTYHEPEYWAEKMRITSDGNVGIGTNTPNGTKGDHGYLDVKDVYLRDAGKWASSGGGASPSGPFTCFKTNAPAYPGYVSGPNVNLDLVNWQQIDGYPKFDGNNMEARCGTFNWTSSVTSCYWFFKMSPYVSGNHTISNFFGQTYTVSCP